MLKIFSRAALSAAFVPALALFFAPASSAQQQ